MAPWDSSARAHDAPSTPRPPILSSGAAAGHACVVANPTAVGFVASEWPALQSYLRAQLGACQFICTADAARAREEIAAACDARCSLLVVVGGDGTIQLALDAIAGRDIPLALVPIGTANDFARSVGGGASLRLAQRLIDVGGAVDLISLNGKRFCTTGCLGVPGEVMQGVQTLRRLQPLRPWLRRLGPWIYPALALQRLVQLGPVRRRYRITTLEDEATALRTVEVHAGALFVSNQSRLGATLLVSPHADNRDGKFELTAVVAQTRGGLLRVLGDMLSGKPPNGADVVRLEATRATIACDAEQTFFADGESLTTASEFRLQILPAALRLGR